MTIRIRLFNQNDRKFILSLIERFSEFDLPEWRSSHEINRTNKKKLENAIKNPKLESEIYVAEDENGKSAGFIHLETQIDYFSGEKLGYIADIAVDKAFERKGIGKSLLKTGEEWAKQRGYKLMWLYVFSGNTRAKAIYKNLGYEEEVVKLVKRIK
jgi:ribosomal protein S18 acetylase RimI-like enzyme